MNIFDALFWRFHCWLWSFKCRLGAVLKTLMKLLGKNLKFNLFHPFRAIVNFYQIFQKFFISVHNRRVFLMFFTWKDAKNAEGKVIRDYPPYLKRTWYDQFFSNWKKHILDVWKFSNKIHVYWKILVLNVLRKFFPLFWKLRD